MKTKKTKYNPAFQMSPKEKAAATKRTKDNMKKLGFKTVEEYIRYIDKKRGY